MRVRSGQDRHRLLFATGDLVLLRQENERGLVIGVQPTDPNDQRFKAKKKISQVSLVVLNLGSKEASSMLY